MASLASLKNNRANKFNKLKDRIEKEGKKDFTDSRIWRCERDKAGNGMAVIRFLQPSAKDMELVGDDAPPFVSRYGHGFKGDGGKWYIENCPTTIGKECPVCEANSELVESNGGWKAIPEGTPAKKLVRARKRKQKYYANILVVQDKANPENEGKVFLFEYGPKIHGMITSAMFPEFEDEEALDPFDFWDGHNFKLKIRDVEGNANYDKSEFEKGATPVATTDDAIEKIWNQCYSLQEFIAEDQFKDYDALKKRFDMISGAGKPVGNIEDEPAASEKTYRKPGESTKPTQDEPDEPDDTGSDGDADYFASLLD